MASLAGKKIKDTYKSLLKVSDNGEVEITDQEITDGAGNSTGVSFNTQGNVTATGTVSFGSLKDSGENITITKFVDEADGIANNDNDSSVPTSAAVRDYVDNNITAQDLDISDGTNIGAVDLDSQSLIFTGDSGVSATVSGQTVTFDSSALQSQITANDGDIATLQTDVDALEVASTALSAEIDAETAARIAADSALNDLIDAESASRAAQDAIIETDINTETAARIAADSTLQSNIDAEATTRENADNAIQAQITSNDTDIAALDTRLTTAEGNITSNDTDIAGLDTRVTIVEANQATTGVDFTALEARVTVNEGDIDTLETGKQSISEKGQANGYAPLDAGAKVPTANLPDSVVGQVQYQGTWDASTNTPTLPDPTTVKGHYYVTSVQGDYLGTTYHVGDWVISSGVAWEIVDNTDAVTNVFGRLGAIVANESDYSAFYPLLSDLAATDANVLANTTKLAGIENGAEVNPTASEIKTQYESNADTNAFTDAEKSKLAGIESGAEVNTVDSVNTQTGAVVLDADDIDDTTTVHKFTTAGDITKLAGIEAGADITDATNVTAALATIPVTAHSDVTSAGSGAIISSAERTKLQGIETGADVTDVANVTTAINSISVTEHSDVTSAGSGAIITSAERTQLQNAEATYTPSIISGNTNAAIDTLYVLTASLTLTLPASPSVGDKIALSNLSGTTTPVIARNGNNIMGLAEDLTIDVANAGIELRYADATNGWVIL